MPVEVTERPVVELTTPTTLEEEGATFDEMSRIIQVTPRPASRSRCSGSPGS